MCSHWGLWGLELIVGRNPKTIWAALLGFQDKEKVPSGKLSLHSNQNIENNGFPLVTGKYLLRLDCQWILKVPKQTPCFFSPYRHRSVLPFSLWPGLAAVSQASSRHLLSLGLLLNVQQRRFEMVHISLCKLGCLSLHGGPLSVIHWFGVHIVWLCRCTRVHSYVCLCMHAHLWARMWRLEDNVNVIP